MKNPSGSIWIEVGNLRQVLGAMTEKTCYDYETQVVQGELVRTSVNTGGGCAIYAHGFDCICIPLGALEAGLFMSWCGMIMGSFQHDYRTAI